MLQLICLCCCSWSNNSSSLIHMYIDHIYKVQHPVFSLLCNQPIQLYQSLVVKPSPFVFFILFANRCFDSRLWSCGDDRTFLLLCVRSFSTWIFNKKYLPKQKGFAISVSFTHFSFRTNTYRRCRCGYHEGRKWLYDERRQPINSIHQ